MQNVLAGPWCSASAMSVFAARVQAPFIAAYATGRGSAGDQAHVSLLPELFVSGFIGKSQAAAERLPG